MKFKEILNQTKNKANQQISFNLRKKQLKKLGMTAEQLLETTLIKPKVKFIKKVKGGKNEKRKKVS